MFAEPAVEPLTPALQPAVVSKRKAQLAVAALTPQSPVTTIRTVARGAGLRTSTNCGGMIGSGSGANRGYTKADIVDAMRAEVDLPPYGCGNDPISWPTAQQRPNVPLSLQFLAMSAEANSCNNPEFSVVKDLSNTKGLALTPTSADDIDTNSTASVLEEISAKPALPTRHTRQPSNHVNTALAIALMVVCVAWLFSSKGIPLMHAAISLTTLALPMNSNATVIAMSGPFSGKGGVDSNNNKYGSSSNRERIPVIYTKPEPI